VLIVGLVLLHKFGRSTARWLILPVLVLTVVSIYAMAHLYSPAADPTRVYEGTDTRAFGLLIGAMLAMAWPVGRQVRPGKSGRVAADVAGFAGLAVIGLMIWRVGQYSAFAYRGGLAGDAAVFSIGVSGGTPVALVRDSFPGGWSSADELLTLRVNSPAPFPFEDGLYLSTVP